MGIGEIILISAALCIDSAVISLTVGMQKHVKVAKGLQLALICALVQGILFLLGSLLGGAFKSTFDYFDHWIAAALLFIIGVKMLIEAKKGKASSGFDISHFMVMLGLAVATSIDAFIVGISIGLSINTMADKLYVSLLVFVMTFLLSIFGFYLGKKHKIIPVKFSTAIGGLVLIGLAIKVLIEHKVLFS